MHTVWQDLRYGVHMLWKNPGFTAIAVLTLALGIGATAAVFSVLYAVVLRPLPVDHPERIVQLWPTNKGEASAPAPAEYVALRDNGKFFDHIAAGVLSSGVTLNEGDTPELIEADRVTADYFDVFGV